MIVLLLVSASVNLIDMNDIFDTSISDTPDHGLPPVSGHEACENVQAADEVSVSGQESHGTSSEASFAQMSVAERISVVCDKVSQNGVSLGGAKLRSVLEAALAGRLEGLPSGRICDWKSSYKLDYSKNREAIKQISKDMVNSINGLGATDYFVGKFQESIQLYNLHFPKNNQSILSFINHISKKPEDCYVFANFAHDMGMDELSIKWTHMAACAGNHISMMRLAEKLGQEAILERSRKNHEESYRLARVSGAWWRLSMASSPKTSYMNIWDALRNISYKDVDLLSLDEKSEEHSIQLPFPRNPSYCPGAIEAEDVHSADTQESDSADPTEHSAVGSGARVETPTRVVVLASITESGERDIKEVLKRFRCLTEPMPFSGGANPDVVHATLATRFPWMTEANRRAAQVASVAKASRTPGQLRLNSPLVLVGPSGAGKSLWGRSLAKVLGLHLSMLSFAGLSSSKLLTGTERGWGSSHPSFPAVAMRQHMTANPMLLIDEADKTASSDYNGDLLQVLSSMTEPSTSRHYLDTCLLGELDLSWISWVLTVNSLAPLPQPLLDRSTIIHVTAPSEEHYDSLFEMVRDGYIEDNNLRPEAVPDVSDQTDVIRRKFLETRSVRALKMAYEEAVLSRMWQEPGHVEPTPSTSRLRLV